MTAPKDTPTTAAPRTTTTTPAVAPSQKRSISVGQVLAGILLVLVVIFIAENNDDVRLRIIAGPKVTMPMWLALFAAAVVGALIAGLMRYRRKHKTPKNSRS